MHLLVRLTSVSHKNRELREPETLWQKKVKEKINETNFIQE